MAGPVPSITSVPLREVLPPDYLGAEDDLRRLAHDLDSHRSAAGRVAWYWYPGAEPPQVCTVPGEMTGEGGVYLLLVDTAITLYDTGVDWLELTLDISWSPSPRLTVNAAVEVACWRPEDHNMHQVRTAQWRVATGSENVAAFAVGTEMLVDVSAKARSSLVHGEFRLAYPVPPKSDGSQRRRCQH